MTTKTGGERKKRDIVLISVTNQQNLEKKERGCSAGKRVFRGGKVWCHNLLVP